MSGANKKPKVQKSRNFSFTVYGINEAQSDSFIELINNKFCRTVGFTHELGEEGNNPHIQGFLICEVPNSLSNVKKKINEIFENKYDVTPNPHLEISKGSAYQNYEYIIKELKNNKELKHCVLGEPVLPPGKKRDDSKFESYTELLEKGEITLKKIEETDLAHYQRHEAFYLGIYSKLCKRGIKPPSFIAWFSGSTATGKSFTARRIAEILKFDLYDMDCHNNFFNHYSGEELSLWDDYRSGPITFSTLLRITDMYGTNLNIKGGKVFFCPRIQIYTSPDGIESAKTAEMLEKKSQSLDNKFDQLKRRVSCLINFKASERDVIPCDENVLENSDNVIKYFLGSYRQFLIDHGFEKFIEVIPNLKNYEPIKNVKLVDKSKTCKVSFSVGEEKKFPVIEEFLGDELID